jgi:O-antigen ligase
MNILFEWLVTYRRQLFICIVFSMVLFASILLSNIANPLYMELLIALIVGTGAFILLVRHPPLGWVFLIISSLMIPFGIGTGSQTNINIVIMILILMLVVWILMNLVNKLNFKLFTTRAGIPLVVFTVVVILSLGVGQLRWFSLAQGAPIRAQVGGAFLYFFAFIAFLLPATQIHEVGWLKKIVWVFLALGSVYMLVHTFPGLDNIFGRFFVEGSTGSLFWTWMLALSLSQALYNRELKMVWRIILGGIALLTLYSGIIVYETWSSGWIPGLVAALVILFFGSPPLAIGGSILAGIVAVINWSSFENMLMAGDNSYSLSTRLAAWSILLQIVKVNPFFGLGPANYYFYTPLFPIMGYAVQFNSHNNYIDLLAQTGFLGMACFLWFAWEVGRLGWNLKSKVPQGFPNAYVIGAMGGLAGTLVAMMLGDWVIPFVYNVGFNGFRASAIGWLFLGGLVVLEGLYMKKNESQSI